MPTKRVLHSVRNTYFCFERANRYLLLVERIWRVGSLRKLSIYTSSYDFAVQCLINDLISHRDKMRFFSFSNAWLCSWFLYFTALIMMDAMRLLWLLNLFKLLNEDYIFLTATLLLSRCGSESMAPSFNEITIKQPKCNLKNVKVFDKAVKRITS